MERLLCRVCYTHRFSSKHDAELVRKAPYSQIGQLERRDDSFFGKWGAAGGRQLPEEDIAETARFVHYHTTTDLTVIHCNLFKAFLRSW